MLIGHVPDEKLPIQRGDIVIVPETVIVPKDGRVRVPPG
jgi:hypothetical protein